MQCIAAYNIWTEYKIIWRVGCLASVTKIVTYLWTDL